MTFAQGVIPHHQQAIEMAKLADKRADSTEVKNLTAGIQAAQDPEIMKMGGWLKDRNKPVVSGEMPGMDMGSGSMPGMMSAAKMKSLQTGAGTEFDLMFLTMMIKHHEGAITTAASRPRRTSLRWSHAFAATATPGRLDQS